jgi:hypothetical protein
MFLLDKLSYFLITRAKSVVSYLKKFTTPRYVIAFVIIYPHIYTNIVSVISATQELLTNLADQFFSWIEASFWGIHSYVKDKLQGIWFADQIAYLVAGLAMALPFLAYIIFKYAFTPVATALLTVSLNVLGAVFYIFCRVVIPALKMAYGAYLFARFMPASYKYVAKALDRFAQGKFGGFVGALFGAFAPFSMFFIGPLIISTVVDPACSAAYAPLTIQPPYQVPYVSPAVYHFALNPVMSWIISSIYGQYLQQQSAAMSYINASASWDVREMMAYSYILPNIAFGAYPTGTYGPYYPGAYISPTPALSAIYASLFYSLVSGYPPYTLPYAISYIFTDFLYGFLSATYSYIFTEVPIYSVSIFDVSLLTGPPYAYAYIQDLSYLALPPGISVEILDASNLVHWE